jgi:hypothetical protein
VNRRAVHYRGSMPGRDALERLQADLAAADAELRAHMASWEYAFAMAGGTHGGREHPTHWATRARTDELVARRRALAAQLAEHRA